MQIDSLDRVIPALEARILQLERENHELATSHAQLRAILENEPECVKLLAADGSLLQMNPAGLRMLEADSLLQVQNRCLYPLIVEEYREAFRALNEAVLRGGSGVLEFEIVGLKGSRRWLETHASPLRDESGAIIATLGITRDITVRKRAELERISDAFVTLDTHWRYTYVNRRACELLQRCPEDLIGTPFWAAFAQTPDLPFRHAVETAFAEQQPQTFEGYHVIFDAWIETRIYPYPEGLSLVFTDIGERKRIERALHDSERRLQEAQRIGRIGDWHYDIENHRLTCSPQVYVLYERDPTLGTPDFDEVLEWFDADSRALIESVRHRLTQSGQPQSCELRLTLPSGTMAYHAVTAEPDLDATGRLLGAHGVVQEITERKRAEEALARSEEILRLFVEHSPAAIAMFDRDMRYITASSRYLKDNGLSEQVICGLLHYDLFPNLAERWKETYRRCLSGNIEKCDEEQLVRADGGTDWVRWEIRPWRESSGQIGGIIMFSEVITARKEVEAALQANIEQLKRIYENVEDVLFVLDVTQGCYRFTSVNRRFLTATGLTWAQVVGRRVEEVIPEPALSAVLKYYARAMESGRSVHWEEVSRYPAGTKHGEVSVAPVMNAEGRCTQLIGTVHDTTAAVEAKRRLREAGAHQQLLARRLVEVQEDEQRRLSAELHDRIGQNLTALSINLKIIGGNAADSLTAASVVRLRDSRKLLETTITTVRDLITELRPAALDDYGLLAGLRWFAAQVSARTGLYIVVQGEEPVPRLGARGENALFRIAQEALNNSVKHAQAQRVVLALQCEPDRVMLSIVDDGCGFDPTASRRPGPTTHWGLQMMAERAEAVGAHLRVESKPGRGTRVEIDVKLPP
ncbi:MAG: PAS domain-containing sensor histidine kinase [Steroidobacteraceae bacterium]